MESQSALRLQGSPIPKASPDPHARRRRRAQILLLRLSKLCLSFPEFRNVLADSVELLKQQIDRCPESDRQLVLCALHLGLWTVEDLKEETKLTRPEIDKILKQLHAAKIIIRKELKETTTLGGRPKILWIPSPNLQPQPDPLNSEK